MSRKPSKAAKSGSSMSLSDSIRAARMLSDARLLLRLDQIWTSAIESAQPVDRSEVAELQAIVEEMVGLLDTIRGRTDWLEALVKMEVKRLESYWVDALPRMPLSDERRKSIERNVRERGGIGAVWLHCIKDAERLIPEEIGDLQTKIRAIASAHPSQGDMSKTGICALYGIGAALAFATVGGAEVGVLLTAIGSVECL